MVDLTKIARADANGRVYMNLSALVPGEYKILARSSGVGDVYKESKASAKATVYANSN